MENKVLKYVLSGVSEPDKIRNNLGIRQPDLHAIAKNLEAKGLIRIRYQRNKTAWSFVYLPVKETFPPQTLHNLFYSKRRP